MEATDDMIVEESPAEKNLAYMEGVKKRIKEAGAKPSLDERIAVEQAKFDELMAKAEAKGGPLGERMKEAALKSPEAKKLRELMKQKERMAESKERTAALREKLGAVKEERRKREDEETAAELKKLREAIIPEKKKEEPELPSLSVPKAGSDEGLKDAIARLDEKSPREKIGMKVGDAKFLDLPDFDVEGYEQALYGVSNLEDEMERAGFLKRLALRGKLKRARAELKKYEDRLEEAKASMNIERARREAGVEPPSPEEKKRRDEAKRTSSRWGMSGGPRF